jgi:transposase-like protein
VELSVPRDRDSSFEPKIVAKRQRRLSGVEDLVISLSAKVILSFRVSRCCDLRCLVVDSVADGTLAA